MNNKIIYLVPEEKKPIRHSDSAMAKILLSLVKSDGDTIPTESEPKLARAKRTGWNKDK